MHYSYRLSQTCIHCNSWRSVSSNCCSFYKLNWMENEDMCSDLAVKVTVNFHTTSKTKVISIVNSDINRHLWIASIIILESIYPSDPSFLKRYGGANSSSTSSSIWLVTVAAMYLSSSKLSAVLLGFFVRTGGFCKRSMAAASSWVRLAGWKCLSARAALVHHVHLQSAVQSLDANGPISARHQSVAHRSGNTVANAAIYDNMWLWFQSWL